MTTYTISPVRKKHNVHYQSIQKELENAHPYLNLGWRTKQTNDLDKLSGFIYHTETFEELKQNYENLIKDKHPEVSFNYILLRWYNHMTSTMTETIFNSFENVRPEKNPYHKTIDLYIHNIPFDVKLSVMPKSFYKYELEDFRKRKVRNELIRWLYAEQSTQGRYHLANRLFVVCRGDSPINNNLESKILKSRFDLIEEKIKTYLEYTEVRKQENPRKTFNQLLLNVKGQNFAVQSDALIIHI